ncbi:unnamed protein product, partial [Coccothraustes coccothraustes]
WNMEQFSNTKIICAQRPRQRKESQHQLKILPALAESGSCTLFFGLTKRSALRRQLQAKQLRRQGRADPGAAPDPARQLGRSHSGEEAREQPLCRNP